MDCCSYSYAPTMLDERTEKRIAYYENYDMEIELCKRNENCFSVWAFSYDGDLDVYEEFGKLEKAAALYGFIFDNYTSSPPNEKEVEKFIKKLLIDGRY